MKLIKNLIFSIMLVFLLMIIYMNANKIYSFFNELIRSENKVVLPIDNQYKRKYDYERFSLEENYIPYSVESIENIYFNVINNGWKEFIFYCPSEYETCQKDVERISSDTTIMSNIAGYTSPYNTFELLNTTVSSNGEVFIKVSKKYTNEEIIEANNKINDIIISLNLGQYEKEEQLKIFHDYIIKNVVYDEEFSETKTSIYRSTKANGVLIDGYAVCGGYTDTIAIFLDILNIPNIMISNNTHTWNLVYIDDEWKHLDATWNDVENEKFKYEFYLINTEELYSLDDKDHSFDKTFFIEAN